MTCLVAVLAMPYALSPLTPMSMLERPAGHAGFLVLEPVALSVPLGSILRFRGCGGRNLCQEIDAGFIVATVVVVVVVGVVVLAVIKAGLGIVIEPSVFQLASIVAIPL